MNQKKINLPHVHLFRKVNPETWSKVPLGTKLYKICRCGETKEFTKVEIW